MAAEMQAYLSPRPPPKSTRNFDNSNTHLRNVLRAPALALTTSSLDFPPKSFSGQRSVRKTRTLNAGTTNRWRYPGTLVGDFLATSQARRALHSTTTTNNFITSKDDDPVLGPRGRGNSPFASVSFCSIGHDVELRNREKFRRDNKQLVRRNFSSSCASRGLRETNRKILTSPLQILQLFAQKANYEKEPDVILECMETEWPLHSCHLHQSAALHRLVAGDLSKKVHFRHASAKRIHSYVDGSDFYSSEYKDMTRRLTSEERERIRVTTKSRGTLRHEVRIIRLKIRDPWVTKHGLALALAHLYLSDENLPTAAIALPGGHVVETLAGAVSLGFRTLADKCCSVLMRKIEVETVALYIEVATKYDLGCVMSACERWLEVNLISSMSTSIHLKHLPMFILDKVLMSPRLFTFREFSIYKILCYWVYLQFHPTMKEMPTQTSVLKFFSSREHLKPFLQRDEGVEFQQVFHKVRLNAITDVDHLQDVVYMNIFPEQMLLETINDHYETLHNGGSMKRFLTFSHGSCRFGFLLDHEVGFYSRIFHLYGFYFELRVKKHDEDDSYSAYIQRLNEGDPVLRQARGGCKRSPLSTKQDRLALYEITVHHGTHPGFKHVSSGVHEHKFGIAHQSARSKVLRVSEVTFPFRIMITMLFPSY